jgi:4-amino-4-deoxy-L-arabinose transferase-like glycosyltransferase
VSWKAWFFGASDAPGSIVIDKPPASVWLTGLSARLFGVNPWSVLAPQAVLGVGSVGLLHLAVRRWFGAGAGLAAGALLALTPVATLMFRFDNPDALLVTLLVAAADAVIRAVDDERAARAGTRWLVASAVLVGTAFLTKSMQAFLVLPPYVGGSQHNSVLELALGYNGVGRLTGEETGSPGGGANGGTLAQLFTSEMATQASWLLPAALAMIAVLVVLRRWPVVAIWGGWLLVTGGVFSLAKGVIHAYYTVALAPAIAALVAIGGAELVRGRAVLAARRYPWPRRDDGAAAGRDPVRRAHEPAAGRLVRAYLGGRRKRDHALRPDRGELIDALRSVLPGRGTRAHRGGGARSERSQRTSRSDTTSPQCGAGT